MSDTESFPESAKIRSHSMCQQRTDEVLNDHRNQRETLPPPDDTAALAAKESQSRAVTLGYPEHMRKTRSYSFGEPNDEPAVYSKGRHTKSIKVEMPRIVRTQTNESQGMDNHLTPRAHFAKRERRPSRVSMDSEADSHASRSSQETEEDVCFPMLREHVRVNGIDFDEIEDFINEENENQKYMKQQEAASMGGLSMGGMSMGGASDGHTSSHRHEHQHQMGAYSITDRKPSKNDIEYPPRNIFKRCSNMLSASGKDEVMYNSNTYHDDMLSSDDPLSYKEKDDSSSDNVKFGGTKINGSDIELPDRFSFFHSDNEETVHSPDIPSLIGHGESVKDLFKNGEGTWWLDCTCPTDAEMKTLAKAFGIHPLTAEDIRMQESREKVELFKNYYFVSFHTFEPDKESEDYLEPIHVYIVVFREGVLTFHFSPVSHPANVRRRVRQLRDYVDVSADWIGYAMIDDITDGFAPVISNIEYEADAIEDSVFDAVTVNFRSMLRRIGQSRRKVMTLMRLLSNKADVIRMFAKRCQDDQWAMSANTMASRLNLNGMAMTTDPHTHAQAGPSGITFGPPPGAPSRMMSQIPTNVGHVQPRADIALYLGDIQDHVVTMFQNLSAYEKIFSRSHTNYLAQLQVESFDSNLTVTNILGNVTMIGTILLPLNVITGLFGMNVNVPGKDQDIWFWGIVAFMVVMVIVSWIGVKLYLRNLENKEMQSDDTPHTIKSFSLKKKKRDAAKSIVSYPNRYD